MIKQFLNQLGKRRMRIVHEDDVLRIAVMGKPARKAADSRVVLCFTGVGLGMGGVQTEEFVGISQRLGAQAVFVTDKRRSWFNAIDPKTLAQHLAPFIEGREVATLGNSMGAFGAIWASSFIDVHTAIAFAPQFSVHPDIVPQETRWREWRDRIDEWKYPDLSAHLVAEGTRYFTFNGAEDEEHWSHFASAQAQTHILVPEAGHDVAKVLKERDALSDVIQACFDGGDPMQVIRAAGMDCRLIG